MISRLLYLLAWIAALWQLWQGVSTGCITIGRLAIEHCFAQSPGWYLFDLVFVIVLVLFLPFLIFFGSQKPKE